MELRTPNCLIRDWRHSDARALARHANNEKIWRNMTDQFPFPYTVENAEDWIATCLGRPAGSVEAALEVDGEACGAIGLRLGVDIQRFSGSLGYWIGEDLWGRGLVTEAVRAFVVHAFAEFPLERISAQMFASNHASARVVEKCGFTLEGVKRHGAFKEGRFCDMKLYSVLRGEVAGNP